MRAELLERVKMGLASPIDLYLLEHDLQDSPENRAQAMEYFVRVAQERKALADAGLAIAA